MPFFFFLVALSIIPAGTGRLTSKSAFSPPLPMLGTGRPGIGNPGNGIPGRAGNSIGPSSSSGFTRSIGYNSSRSSNPGASGIAPSIVDQFSSIMVEVIGFCNHATAPAENAASLAKVARRFGATKTIRASPPCSRISNAAICPSSEGISRDIRTNSGSILMYSSTALSPSWQTSMLKSLILKILVRR